MNDCLGVLERSGLLLKSDPKLPSVTTLVAMEPVPGSWWAHPAGRTIFDALVKLSEHPDVLMVKLVGGKDTFVHRQLWPEVYAIATAHEPWQFKALSASAKQLYGHVQRGRQVEASGQAARELETRLLVHGEQFHSATGAHKKRLESWGNWADRVGFEPMPLPVPQAKRTLEDRLPGARFVWGLRK
jgi:hypothetical protein